MEILEGITAFVTGASQGIGREISLSLAEEGANVILAARGDGIYETEELIGDNKKTLSVKTDVTDEESVKKSIQAGAEKFGGMDCLVNNAGIAGPTAPIAEIEADEWDKTMDVNVKGMFFCIKHAIPYIKQSDQGSIINISSLSGKRPLKNRTPYVASKMAVIGLTRTLAFELGEHNITVNCICPGPVKGPRINNVIEKQAEEMNVSFEEAKRKVFTDHAALGILVDAKDIANQVVYFASEKSRHITAQDVNVTAGTVWY